MGMVINYGFDRRDFLLAKIGQFNTKKDDESVERMYSQLLAGIERMAATHSEMDIAEMKRLLRECYDRFKKEEYRAKVKGMSPRKIAQDLEEEVLGILKRKYDMSDKYSDGLITDRKYPDGTTRKMVGLKPLKDDDERTIPYVDDEWKIIIQQIGTLLYSDGVTGIEDVDQYKITIPIRNGKQKEYDVFAKINFDLLAYDENYRQAVFGELLSRNNIELSNAGGYIGEIVPSTRMEPGEEREDESGFYTYQISRTHALSVDSMAVTAAKIWEARQKGKQQEQQEQ